MKAKKFFAWLFGLLGAVLMVGTAVLCLTSLNAPPKLVEIPQEARQCTEELMDAFCGGDYARAEALLAGKPDLGLDRVPEGEVAERLWQAFADSISYEFDGDCYALDAGLARNVKVTCLDLASVTAALETRAAEILDPARADESGNYPEEYRQQVLLAAVETALKQDGVLVTRDVTLQLIFRDGKWLAAADKALLTAISGGLV